MSNWKDGIATYGYGTDLKKQGILSQHVTFQNDLEMIWYVSACSTSLQETQGWEYFELSLQFRRLA